MGNWSLDIDVLFFFTLKWDSVRRISQDSSEDFQENGALIACAADRPNTEPLNWLSSSPA